MIPVLRAGHFLGLTSMGVHLSPLDTWDSLVAALSRRWQLVVCPESGRALLNADPREAPLLSPALSLASLEDRGQWSLCEEQLLSRHWLG